MYSYVFYLNSMYKHPPLSIGSYSRKILGILTLFSFFSFSSGQSTEIANDSSRLKLYLDCDHCDFAFFRRNMQFVDYVRDPKLAEVHLLVTDQRTGSSGISYGLNFIGRGNYEDLNYKLSVFSPQSDTEVETWERLLGTSKLGLMPFVSRTPEKDILQIKYPRDSTNSVSAEEGKDQWDYWVFRFGLMGHLAMEESQQDYSGHGSIRIDRITEKLKFRSDLSYFRNLERFQDEDEIIEGSRESVDSDLEIIFSLNPRWSAGYFSEIKSSSYENIDFGLNLGPAIEYNLFPWDESDRRILALAYQVALDYSNYTDETVYELMSELRAKQLIRLLFIMRQPWGEIETELMGSHYFHDFSKNRLTLEADCSLNITKGFSVFAEIEASLIHDQLNLPAGEISREDLLLRQRQLETSYSIFTGIGIRYTFGSIYNNIVNDRM